MKKSLAVSNKQQQDFFMKAVVHFLLLSGVVFVIVPFMWMVSTSFKSIGEVFLFPPRWIPTNFVLDNYQQVLRAFPFFVFFRNSVIVSLSIVLGQLITCSLGAFAFARIKFWGRDQLFLLYLGTMMIPGQITMIPIFIIMRQLNWIDTYYALIFPQVFSAFGTFLLRQFFLSIPYSYEEAAILDGGTRLQIYAKIFLPLSKPALATLGMFTFMSSWNNLLWPLIMINSKRFMTLPLGLASLQGQYEVQWNLLMAGTVLSVLPVLIVYFGAQRYFVQGITLSGIKG